ncbi:MAG: restriction endonuclease [Phycisphaerae bacterium]
MAAKRTVESLRKNACLFWPHELGIRERKSSIIPRLIETQEKFIGVLYVADASPMAWQQVLSVTSGMPGNLFLKHLMVLSDVGGEPLKRLKSSLRKALGKGPLQFVWRNKLHEHDMASVRASSSWSNTELGVDGKGLGTPRAMDDPMTDVALLIMHGAAATNPGLPTDALEKCTLGALVGRKDALDAFVRQRYIWVSRITGGAQSNKMGQLAQAYVKECLRDYLPTWNFDMKTIPGVSQTGGRTDMSFDFVARPPEGRCCAIEVTFQVTTNSVIERKSGQAADRQNFLHRVGHRIAYVVDGAGNFERRSALTTILEHSDFTVTFRDDEIRKLAGFLRRLERS